jgi:uncharacterized membrane protein YgaE (UPF0421/DUF939 family)
MYAEQINSREEVRRMHRSEVIRQQKQRRKMVFLIALTLFLMFSIGFGFGSLLSKAQETKQTESYKYYTNVEIQKGDTLWEIADTYMDTAHYRSRNDYMNEIMNINHMTSDRLITGQKIIVPYYSEEWK